jgi:hypothetical protein
MEERTSEQQRGGPSRNAFGSPGTLVLLLEALPAHHGGCVGSTIVQ